MLLFSAEQVGPGFPFHQADDDIDLGGDQQQKPCSDQRDDHKNTLQTSRIRHGGEYQQVYTGSAEQEPEDQHS